MDTRRRSDSRESDRPSTPPEPVAQLFEVGPVPQPSRRPITPLVLGIALFAAGALAGSSLVRLAPADVAAVPSGPPAASSGPAGTTGPSRSPVPTRATPRPTTSPRPTVRPTPVPTDVPWAWATSTFDTDIGQPGGLWSAGGSFVVAMDNPATSAFRISADGTSWRTNYSSRAISAYMGATIVKDRLWFVLRIAGLEADHFEIGYPTWNEEEANVTWATKGAAAGDTPDWVGAFGQVNGTWVMSAGHYVGEGGIAEIRVSDDAIHWSTVHPSGAEDVAIYPMARLGAKLVAIGQLQSSDNTPVALVTTDGYHWKSAAFPGPSGGATAVARMACDASACVAVGNTLPNGIERPAMWRTTNGLDWERVAEDITDARPDGGIWEVVSTSYGFVATGEPDTEILVSRDGAAWQAVPVLARSDTGGIQQLAVSGDRIVGLGNTQDGNPAQWVGDLSFLPFP